MHALTAHHMVGVKAFLDPGQARNMPADDDFCPGLKLAHEAAHFPCLEKIRRNRADRHDVIRLVFQFLDESLAGGKIQHRARC